MGANIGRASRQGGRQEEQRKSQKGYISLTSKALAKTPLEHKETEQAFLPWTLPSALFVAIGIVLAYVGLELWTCIPWILLSFALFFYRSSLLYVSLLSILIPMGYLRYQQVAIEENPFKELLGQEVILSGHSDGTKFTPDGYTASLALSPKASSPVGHVTLRGDLVLASGKRNPGGFDYANYLENKGMYAQFFVDEVISHQAPRFQTKQRLREGVVVGLSPQQAALMEAMTLGIRDDLGDLREIFAASGLAHILALSGLHVGILVSALGVALRPLGRHRYPLLIVLIFAFMFLVGASPSVVRASLMVNAALYSLYRGAGRIQPWPSLALAALISLLWKPVLLFDLSFQLSYLAVIGLLLFTNPLSQLCLGDNVGRLKWWQPQSFIIVSMIVSSASQLLSIPLVLSTFGRIPVFSPLVNVVAVPIATVLVPTGFLAALLGLLSLDVARLVNVFVGPLASLLIFLADVGSSLPGLSWGEIAPIGYAFYGLALLPLYLSLIRKLVLWRALFLVAVAMTCSMISSSEYDAPEIIFIDVGQGDSVLVRLPNRVEILIDAGGTPFSDYDTGSRIVVPTLRALGVDELELVIASHPDTDHIEGLLSVLELMPVQELIIGHPKPQWFTQFE